jgi:hypothetical protein
MGCTHQLVHSMCHQVSGRQIRLLMPHPIPSASALVRSSNAFKSREVGGGGRGQGGRGRRARQRRGEIARGHGASHLTPSFNGTLSLHILVSRDHIYDRDDTSHSHCTAPDRDAPAADAQAVQDRPGRRRYLYMRRRHCIDSEATCSLTDPLPLL